MLEQTNVERHPADDVESVQCLVGVTSANVITDLQKNCSRHYNVDVCRLRADSQPEPMQLSRVGEV